MNHSVLKGEETVKQLVAQAYRDGERAGLEAASAACDKRAAEWGNTGPLPRGGYHGNVPLPTHLQTEAEACAAAVRALAAAPGDTQGE